MIYISANHSGDTQAVSSAARPEPKMQFHKQPAWYEVHQEADSTFVEIGIRYDAAGGSTELEHPTWLREGRVTLSSDVLIDICIAALADGKSQLTRSQFDQFLQLLPTQFANLKDTVTP